MSIRFILIALIFCLLPVKAAIADAPQFLFPAACKIGQKCWIINYIDADKRKEKAQDFMCGDITYNGHPGIDIAMSNFSILRKDHKIPVIAAASGIVKSVSDGMKDEIITPNTVAKIRGKECGNYVFIEHKDGWGTRYCHMLNGSITARPGQQIKAGTKIGDVGLSGLSGWPHLDFSVWKNGMLFDPFSGRSLFEHCGEPSTSLWAEHAHPGYHPVNIFTGGFLQTSPATDLFELGLIGDAPTVLSTNIPALWIWGGLFNVRRGDHVDINVKSPDGDLFIEFDGIVRKNSERHYVNASRQRFDEVWKAGTYIGTITTTRHSNMKTYVDTKTFQIILK